MEILGLLDITIGAFVLIFLLILAWLISTRIRDRSIARYFLPGFCVKMLLCITHVSLVILYYGGGDTERYYDAAVQLRDGDLINQLEFLFHTDYSQLSYQTTGLIDPELTGTLVNLGNATVVKVALLASYFAFKSYLGIAFIFTFLSLTGCWFLFRFFYRYYPQLRKQIALSVIFLPSVSFWATGVLKEPVCLFSLGLTCYCLFQLADGRYQIRYILTAIICAYLLFVIKAYIIFAFSFTFFIFLFLRKMKSIRRLAVKVLYVTVALPLLSGFLWLAYVNITETTEAAAVFSADNLISNIETLQGYYIAGEDQSGSTVDLGRLETNSLGGLIAVLPSTMFAVLFRPFLWEIRNPLMILSALEAAAFMVLTIMIFWRTRFFGAFVLIASEPIVLFCLIFSVVFASMVGVTTFNFGSISRYKIHCLPFFLMALFIIQYKYRLQLRSSKQT